MPTTGNLADQAAQQNLGAIGNIGTLTQDIQGINQGAYLSAPGRAKQLSTIEDMLAGNLDQSTIYENQLRNAEKYGAGGFGSDTAAWQTAIQRGLGLDRQDLIKAGQTAMNQLYAGMPVADASSQLATPNLLEQQQATAQEQALEQQRIQNQASQFAQAQAQQLGEFGTTTALDAAQQYARTYGNIPGYNQYGQWTGQIGSLIPSEYLTGGATGTTTGTVSAPTGLTAGQQPQYLGSGTRSSPYTPNPLWAGASPYTGTSSDPGSWDWLQDMQRQSHWGVA